MDPITFIPIAILSFLGGKALGRPRRVLSMLPPEKTSPLFGVPTTAWHRFVTVMVVAPANSRTPRGRMGLFGMTPRHLADIGFMTRPRKTVVDGEPGVWTGDWASPLDVATFLGAVPVQYEAFSRSMRRAAEAARPHVGTVVDGVPATLSGLLAVGYSAGTKGIDDWVKNSGARARFAATTEAFRKANDIF
jgi:hypothetical protein